ncbi:MAG TPA: response regulator [Bradyrhizobium sp.]|jgi:CheY-like chemotaxis protein|nr:response regulator [Bradyrhizobium sp.]
MNSAADKLSGQRVLIVEDEYFLAQDLAEYLNHLGVEVVGPVGTVTDALELLHYADIQGAVLDINLRGERVYPVADVLEQKQVPFVFASGYGGELEPNAYTDIPRCIKPLDFAELANTLLDQMNGHKAGD